MPPQMHSSAKAASTRDSDSQTAVKDDIGRSISGKAKKKMMITTSGGSDRMTSAKITIGTDSHGRRTARSTASARPNATPVTETRSEEHTSELQSLMRISYAVVCLKKQTSNYNIPF